jgi:single-strand DNA-binding protein
MAGETVITVIGNLTNDPELRFTPSGAAVAGFTVASTPRTLDRESNQWKDGDPLFLRCSVWRQYAENVAESLTKGMQVIVQGRLKQRSYETREGEKRTVVELDVDEIGPCLKFATAKVTRATRGSGGSGGGYNGGNSGGGGGGDWANAAPSGGGSVQRSGGQQSGGQSSAPQDDPWATSGGSGGSSGGGWGGGYSDEPPF